MIHDLHSKFYCLRGVLTDGTVKCDAQDFKA